MLCVFASHCPAAARHACAAAAAAAVCAGAGGIVCPSTDASRSGCVSPARLLVWRLKMVTDTEH